MYDSVDLSILTDSSVLCRDGRYRPARPIPDFLKQRFLDALEVLRGRAVAVYLYDGSETGPYHAQLRGKT